MAYQEKILGLIKALVLAYTVTAGVLIILAVGVWKFDFSENMVNIGMILSYIASTLFGGLYLGKKQREKKFLWGILLGLCYIFILLAVSMVANGPSGLWNRNTITTVVICLLGGMLGGMIG
jgi:putative membrane protein (TIGR04086 family)